MKYTFETEDVEEAKILTTATEVSSNIDEFWCFLRRYDKHVSLGEEAWKVLEDIRNAAKELKGSV